MALYVSGVWTHGAPAGRELYYRTRAAVTYDRTFDIAKAG
jgi:hypothetical protein